MDVARAGRSTGRTERRAAEPSPQAIAVPVEDADVVLVGRYPVSGTDIAAAQ